MITVIAENQDSPKDKRIFEAVKQMVELYPDDTLADIWETQQKVTFENYVHSGKGGSHIWISRKSDNKRIVLITEAEK